MEKKNFNTNLTYSSPVPFSLEEFSIGRCALPQNEHSVIILSDTKYFLCGKQITLLKSFSVCSTCLSGNPGRRLNL